MHNVFTYGSLMFEDVWQKVVRGKYAKLDGVLSGYNRRAVKNEEYPALVKGDTDDKVGGVVYKDVSLEDIQRLDTFEGIYYKRQTEQVLLPGNQLLSVVFYLLKPEYHHILSNHRWNLENFKREGIHEFLDKYGGFGDIKN